MQNKTRQTGYNLVEMAIALVVLGLLLGGSLVPIQVRYKQEQINSAKAQLQDAKEALFAYALRNKTVPRRYTAAHDNITYNIPAGRPYLPCPDINIDGLEDRDMPTPPSGDVLTDLEIGKCAFQKGLLPWKTLGLKRLDPWGNHLTYRVDLAYSNHLLGFDEQTRADITDPQNSLLDRPDGYFYQRRPLHTTPNLICDTFYNMDSTPATTTPGCPNVALNNLVAGVITNVSITIGARQISAYDSTDSLPTGVVDGPIFVVLSHGRNGWGARNRDGLCRISPPINRIPGAEGNQVGEIANAFYTNVGVLPHPLYCPPLNATPIQAVLSQHIFVKPEVIDYDAFGNDDILIYSSDNEMFGVLLRAGALPIQHAGFLLE